SGAWADAARGDEELSTNQEDLTGRIGKVGDQIMRRFDAMGVPRVDVPTVEPSASAQLSRAASIGSLSVPPGWTTAAPEIRLATLAVPATSLGAVPEAFAGGPAALFGEMTAGSMAGQAINGTVSPGRRERVGAAIGAGSTPSPATPGSRMPA